MKPYTPGFDLGRMLRGSALALVLFGIPSYAQMPAPNEGALRNMSQASESLVNTLLDWPRLQGKVLTLSRVNVLCIGQVCMAMAGGQSLMVEETGLDREVRRQLLSCTTIGCPATVTGVISQYGGRPRLKAQKLIFDDPTVAAAPVAPSPPQPVSPVAALPMPSSPRPTPQAAPAASRAPKTARQQMAARKELNSMGVPWTSEKFCDALLQGDMLVAQLFIDGGMAPDVIHSSAGMAVPFYVIAQNKPGSAKSLQFLIKHGLDPNATIDTDSLNPMYPKQQTLLEVAERYRHENLIQILKQAGADR